MYIHTYSIHTCMQVDINDIAIDIDDRGRAKDTGRDDINMRIDREDRVIDIKILVCGKKV